MTLFVADSIHLNVIDEVEASVLVAERPTDRSFLDRLFGRGRHRK